MVGWVSLTTGLVAGVGAVIGSPVLLGAAGFTSAGVAAGSIAAAVQGPAVASGSLFAVLQSAGAAGLAVSTKVAIGGAVGSAVAFFL